MVERGTGYMRHPNRIMPSAMESVPMHMDWLACPIHELPGRG